MIYVEKLKRYPRSKNWRHGEACWLVAGPVNDDRERCLESLHAFADSIFLKRQWMRHSLEGVPHYVLSPQRRLYAIAQGAHEAEAETLREIINSWQAVAADSEPQKARGSRATKPGSHAIQQPTTTEDRTHCYSLALSPCGPRRETSRTGAC